MTDAKGQPSVNSNWPKTKKSMEAHNRKRRRKKKKLNQGLSKDVKEDIVSDKAFTEIQQSLGHNIIKGVNSMKIQGMLEETPVEWKIDTGAKRTFISRKNLRKYIVS